MPNETDFLNDALGQVGAAPITAIDDQSTNANHCQRFYPPLRDAWLRSCHWKFAKTRAELAQDTTPPLFEFAFSYALPADPWCLKVIEYNGANLDTSTLTLFESATLFKWKVEGRHLYTNDGTVLIVYLARIDNPDQWDGLFYQGLSTALASKLALAIPKDRKLAQALFEQSQVLWSQAVAVDGQEGSVEPYQVDDLIWGR